MSQKDKSVSTIVKMTCGKCQGVIHQLADSAFHNTLKINVLDLLGCAVLRVYLCRTAA